MSGITITTTETVPGSMVHDLLCSALEGGSNYWYQGLRVDQYPDGTGKGDFEFWHLEIPLLDGGVLKFKDKEEPDADAVDEDGYYRLDLKKIQGGLETMRRDYPRQWKNAIRETGDADTGDIFLQCCVFGSVVYG